MFIAVFALILPQTPPTNAEQGGETVTWVNDSSTIHPEIDVYGGFEDDDYEDKVHDDSEDKVHDDYEDEVHDDVDD